MLLNLLLLKSLAKLTERVCYQFLPEDQTLLLLPIRAEPWGFRFVNFMCKMVAFEVLPFIFFFIHRKTASSYKKILVYKILILVMGNSITGQLRLEGIPGGWLVQPQFTHQLGEVSQDFLWSTFKCLQSRVSAVISGQHVRSPSHSGNYFHISNGNFPPLN